MKVWSEFGVTFGWHKVNKTSFSVCLLEWDWGFDEFPHFPWLLVQHVMEADEIIIIIIISECRLDLENDFLEKKQVGSFAWHLVFGSSLAEGNYFRLHNVTCLETEFSGNAVYNEVDIGWQKMVFPTVALAAALSLSLFCLKKVISSNLKRPKKRRSRRSSILNIIFMFNAVVQFTYFHSAWTSDQSLNQFFIFSVVKSSYFPFFFFFCYYWTCW